MPEGSEDATLLIATSWQALKRARSGDERTLLCNCTVVIVFAAFFIEANLNHIIETMNKSSEASRFLGNYAGLQDKLAWFYNCYIARQKANNKDEMFDNGIVEKLKRKFPGFCKIHQFRNNISHGKIDKRAASLDNAERLRNRAKFIVDELYRIAAKKGYLIPRSVTYEVAISNSRNQRGHK